MSAESVDLFRDRLRKALKNKNIKQIELAEMLGIDKRTVNKWLNAQKKFLPRANTISSIAEALNVSVDYLFGVESLEESNKKIAEAIGQQNEVVEPQQNDLLSVEDFARIKEKSKNLDGLDDFDLEAAEVMIKATLSRIEKERALRTAQYSGAV
jgi:transcriptional regulator with XRE-family HTH domain